MTDTKKTNDSDLDPETHKELLEIASKITPEDRKRWAEMGQTFCDNLNKNVKNEGHST